MGHRRCPDEVKGRAKAATRVPSVTLGKPNHSSKPFILFGEV